MDIYQEQQFGFFLQTATERFVVRIEERFRGADGALQAIENASGDDASLLTEFTNAVFEDFLLNNVAGACFVLQALAKRRVPDLSKTTNAGEASAASVEATLTEMAKALFADLLRQKTIEALQQHSRYQSV